MNICDRKRKNNYLCTKHGRTEKLGAVCSDSMVPIQRYSHSNHMDNLARLFMEKHIIKINLIIMYLKFVSDLFHTDDYISIQCGNETFIGTILKLSNDMIALRQKDGNIIIKRDDEITNIDSGGIKNSSQSVDMKVAPLEISKVDLQKVPSSITIGEYNPELKVSKIDILNLAIDFENYLSTRELNILITENAHVTETSKHTIVVSTNNNPKYRVSTKTIITNQLLYEVTLVSTKIH